MKRTLKRVLLASGGVFLAIQLVPVPRSDPPVAQTVTAPPEVERLLRRACFDCHSREPRRPFYAYVAPVSWLVAYDITQARKHLDFSDWAHSAKERDEISEVVDEGEMPPWFYSMMSADRQLGEAERAVLVGWAREGTHHARPTDQGGPEDED